MRRKRGARTAPLALVLALARCSGSIGAGGEPASGGSASEPGTRSPSGGPAAGGERPGPTSGGPSASGPGSSTAGGTGVACATPLDLAPSPLRRLTRTEYNNTVRDLLFVTSRPADAFQQDESLAGFESNALAPVTRTNGDQYKEAAESLAAAAPLAKLLPCDPGTAGEEACARSFAARFGRRAFRRKLEPAEVDRLMAVYKTGRQGADFAAGVRLVITALLQAPNFLYRPELAPPDRAGDNVAALSGSELASRLSYFLWASMPDDKLLDLADAGSLRAPQTLEAEARRLLGDPRASDAVKSFARQWLGLTSRPDKDEKVYPEFNAALWASMTDESTRFFDWVVRDGDRSLKTLLTAPTSFVDAGLARLYGLPAPGGSGLVKVDLPADQRAGILTQASLLAVKAFPNQPSPIHRGKFVRENLLCQSAPPPPADLAVKPPGLDPTKPTRQRFDEHRANPMCSGCHQLMDPIGYGFMHYDAIGRWQTLDGKFPVDAVGEISGTPATDGKFDGAVALGGKLAASPDVQRCLTEQWLRFALGRLDGAGESCAVDALARRFVASGLDLRELLVAVVTSDLFRQRRVAN